MLFVTLVWGCLVAGASLLDGTLRLPAPGRGLMEHYGFQASFVSAPLMLLTCLHAVSNFLRILAKIDDMLVPGADPAAVRSIVKPHVEFLALTRKLAQRLMAVHVHRSGSFHCNFSKA